MRTCLMRINVVVAAFLLLAVVPSRAHGQQPVILDAIVSADGTTLFVNGFNFGSQPFLTLDGIPLGDIVVVSGGIN